MKNKNTKINITPAAPKKRLSMWRLFIALLILAGTIRAGFMGFDRLKEVKSLSSFKPWFSPYVDVTATPLFAFEQPNPGVNGNNIVLSFIVSSKTDACVPTWGSAYTLTEANERLDLDRRIARYRQQEGNIAISFGGLLNNELARNCKDPEKLKSAYKEVIEKYGIDTLDFDLEGETLKDTESLKRRADVIGNLQKEYRADHKNLAVWLTLPVSPQGLSEDGTRAVSQMLKSGVDLAGVNVMTMDYGSSKDKNLSMSQASEKALTETHRQLGILFKQEGINLSASTLWSKIGATPMIGQNDVPLEIFTLEDAKSFNEFAVSKKIARMSMWSANRDIECGENYVSVTVVSDSCSGVKQDKGDYAIKLSQGFYGKITGNASLKTKEDPVAEVKPDNPEESPYQIWSESGTYLEGTKVVWHHNVYQAKWWTQGDLPDNPVLQSWQTPWQLVGPVLPGEKPIAQPTLPIGTYPTWSGTEIYDEGQRVLFNGVPYQAKWWTQGDSPAAATSNPDSSPWVVLSREEIEKLLNKINQ